MHTDEQLQEMKRHAVAAGDVEKAKLCDAAMKGDRAAREKLEHTEVQPELPAAPV